MKKFLGIALLIFAFTLSGYKTQAQNVKFGHINSDELIQSMPDYDTATAQFEKYRKELVNQLELLTVELNNKSDAYQKESKNYSDLVKQSKEQELVDMNRRIQDFQANAQTELQNKQASLFQPIMAKVDKAIKDVGKENGFTYIFDVAKGSLLYFDETKSTNILPLAKAKLGLKK